MAYDKKLAECAVLCNMIIKRVHQIDEHEQNVTEVLETLKHSFIEAISDDFIKEKLKNKREL